MLMDVVLPAKPQSPQSRRKISWWKTATSAARLVPSDELEASSITQQIGHSKRTNSKHTGINLKLEVFVKKKPQLIWAYIFDGIKVLSHRQQPVEL